jgi:hypothetical protein
MAEDPTSFWRSRCSKEGHACGNAVAVEMASLLRAGEDASIRPMLRRAESHHHVNLAFG